MKFTSDIDIDFADRSKILDHIRYTAASINSETRHNTGIYVTQIPHNPSTNSASIDYHQAEQRGYIKLDFLNVNLYSQIANEEELLALMNQPPDWKKLYSRQFCEQLIHIGNHYNTLLKMPEPIDSIPRLAMFLAIIRPGKRELIGLPWAEVAKTIWVPPTEGYYFKKSHSVSYAHLVVVNMNLLSRSSN
jgi:hypothetical protein